MIIALHKGKGLVARLIRLQTRSPYAHAAVVLDSGTEMIEAQPEGVVLSPVRTQALDGDEKHFFQVNTDSLQRRVITSFLHEQIGKPYDFTMVARFVTRRQEARKSSGKWFCSELVFAAFKKAGIDLLARTEPWEVSPGMLARSPLLKQILCMLLAVLVLPLTSCASRTVTAPLGPLRPVTIEPQREIMSLNATGDEGPLLSITRHRPGHVMVTWAAPTNFVYRAEASTNLGLTWQALCETFWYEGGNWVGMAEQDTWAQVWMVRVRQQPR